ncbi:LysM peptidoglycan-binding domain-containing protein (plasmid) [Ensifer adhaerens]|uniref:LysM peptidoglycan-binding domain-containing protein n=1 Tax=Ensifer adhaerens TaxID=106592 RepID=UPI0021011091|nr:LysM domain-containing protein [Ensifer adhaerens]UTV41920.1 LysM peptidoglycan-binding domain-containing protein [Ensifer adhaerens]
MTRIGTNFPFSFILRASSLNPEAETKFWSLIRTRAPMEAPAVLQAPQGAKSSPETEAAITKAQTSQRNAEKLYKPFEKKGPESDPTAWSLYSAQKSITDQDTAKAEQAIAADLRRIYRGDADNTAVTEAAVHEIAYRYHDDPQIQRLFTKALETVKSETPTQRTTNEKLHEVNRASDQLDALLADNADGKLVPEKDLQAASDDLDARRKEMLAAAKRELNETFDELPTTVALKELDPMGYAQRLISGRYANDPELKNAVDAARIVQEVCEAPEKSGMQKLGELTPKSLDPTVRSVVMSDPGVKKVIDAYVANAKTHVDQTYKENGTLAAATKLRDVVDPKQNSAVTPEISARIINESLPGTITDIVKDIGPGGNPRWSNDVRMGATQTDVNRVAEDLSAAVDFAAAGSDPIDSRWNSKSVEAAIKGVGRLVATNPNASLQIMGFREAVSNGHVTLALESIAQTKNLERSDLPPGEDFDTFIRNKSSSIDRMLDAVEHGIEGFQKNTKSELEGAQKNLAPFLVPTDRYGSAMTEQQLKAGIAALGKDNPKIVEAVSADRQKLDDLGYRLVRSSEAVQFYRKDLGSLEGYKEVDGARVDLMNQQETASALFLSDSATRRVAAQAARKKLGDDWQTAGAPLPQKYGIGAQFLGDFTEFLAETYVVKGVAGGENMPGVQASRVAHLPAFAGPAIWGAGGGLQAALTVYLYDNVKFDQDQQWRKPILLGLVGGFAAFHLAEAGMAMARLRPHMFDQFPKLRDGFADRAPWIYVEPGSKRDMATRAVVEATKPLIATLAGLMSVAVVWDASGVWYNAGKDDVKAWTHGANLASDTILLRLQVRELAKKILESPALRDGVYKSVLGKLATSKGLDLIERALAKAPILGSNPIGWLVNIGYMTTTIVNWAVDQNRSQNKLEGLEKSFLMGAGITGPQAEVLKSHGWWTGSSEANGFAAAYHLMGGDPEKFVEYVNSIPPDKLGDTMTAAAGLSPENGGRVPDTQPGVALLRLPPDPSRVNVQLYSNIKHNELKDRWEDPETGMVLSNGDNRWRYDNDLGVAPITVNYGSGKRAIYEYDPKTHVTEPRVTSMPIRPLSIEGLKNWLNAHGVPDPHYMDSVPVKPVEKANPPKQVPSPLDNINVYEVKRGDSIYKIAGNDHLIVSEIYRLNPWLDDRLEQWSQLGGGPRGRNPNELVEGDKLTIPQGYKVEMTG